MQKLTLKQKAIYDFLVYFTLKNGYQPTVKDVQNYFRLRSPRTVSVYYDQLKKRGWIRKSSKIDSNRALAIPEIVEMFKPLLDERFPDGEVMTDPDCEYVEN